jgi:hypothetical protein
MVKIKYKCRWCAYLALAAKPSRGDMRPSHPAVICGQAIPR